MNGRTGCKEYPDNENEFDERTVVKERVLIDLDSEETSCDNAASIEEQSFPA